MPRDTRAEALLIVVAFVWGGTFAAIKGGLDDISPMLLVGIRFVLAAVLAVPILLRRTDRPLQALWDRRTWLWGLLIGIGMLAGYAGQTVGLRYTTIARSSFITYSFALYVPFLQFFILGRRPDWGNLLGLVVVVWGLSFVTDPSGGPLSLRDLSPLRVIRVAGELGGGGLNRGDLFTLGGAVGYAFYVVLLDRATREVHPGAVTVVQMLSCGVLALALAPLVEDPMLRPTWGLAGAMAYLVVLGSILALALMNWFQRRISPLRAVLIYSLEPVFATLIGWALFAVGMSPREAIGAALILGGIVVSDLWVMLVPSTQRRRSNRRQSKG